jgi:hypothetical protein
MQKLAAICLLLAMPLATAAVEDGQVMYTGGTVSSLQAGALGRLDTSSEAALSFESSGTKLVIPYARMESFQYIHEVARHLGVLPAIAVGLVKKRQRRHFFQISFRDDSNVSQVAIFEVPKQMPQTLLAVLRTRAPQACKPAYAMTCHPRDS